MTKYLFNWIILRLQAIRLAKSGLFDRSWYIQTNQDVDFKTINPVMHWLETGWHAGRDPHPLFQTQWYLNEYPEVKQSGQNPLIHYISSGVASGMNPNPLFDSTWYLNCNPDVKDAGMNPLIHYCKFGAQEKRDPHPIFLTKWYLDSLQEEPDTELNPLIHYFLIGKKQGGKPHPVYDSVESWKNKKTTSAIKKSIIHRKIRNGDESKLTVGFAVTDDSPLTSAGDYFTARELADALHDEFGWKTKFVSKNCPTKSWYDVTGLDFLIVMVDEYDIRNIFASSENLVLIAWMRNWFDRWATRPWVKEFDICFCSSEFAEEFISKNTNINASVLRLASNPKRFHTNIQSTEALTSDYCFTGNYWNAARDIENLKPSKIPFRFNLYGSGWEGHKQFSENYKGNIPYREIGAVYGNTKVLLDDANHATKEWGSVNSRVFDGLLSGALVITNGEKGASEIFKGDLPVYRSTNDLKRQLTYFIEHPDERSKLVNKLRREVLENHTYTHRAHQLRKTILKRFALGNRIAIKVPVPFEEEKENWGDYHLAKGLADALELLGFHVRIDFMQEWYTAPDQADDVVIVIRGLSYYQPSEDQINCIWLISHPEKTTDDELQQFDHVFVASRLYTKELKSRLKTNVSELLQCTDPHRFRFRSNIEKNQNIVFVGNSRKTARPIVMDAIHANLNPMIYGRGWEGIIDKKFIAGNHIPNETLGDFYASSGVVLNDHWETMKDNGFISNRIFDALCCGARVISDSASGINELFGDLIYTYTNSPIDLKVQTNRALNENDEKAQTRASLAQKIADQHGFTSRAKEISRTLCHDYGLFPQ